MKKLISLVLTFLLLTSTIYVPSFAAPVSSDDVITYAPDYTVVIDENFEKGTIGNSVSGITHKVYVNNNVGSDPNYLSFTYENGVGGNTSKVGKLYDKASRAAKSEVTRYNEDGTEDTNALYDKTSRNRDSYIFSDTIAGAKHVVTKFKYYHAEGAQKLSDGKAQDVLYVQHSIASGLASSTTPTIKITGDSAYVNHRVITSDSDTGGVQNKLDLELQTKKWYDVTFETIYDTVEKCAISTLTIDGHSVTGEIRKNNAIGYDEPNGVSMYIDYSRGGLFFIDDLQVIKYHKVPDSFKTVVNDFTFDEVVAAGTENTQSAVKEAWTDGLMTTYAYGGKNYKVEWKSSDASIISADGKIISRKTETQDVTLTAKIIDPDDSGVWATREFDVVVPAREISYDSEGDEINFSVPTTVLFSDDFNKGGIGDAVPGFHNNPLAGTQKNAQGSSAVDTSIPSFATLTYDYGVGTNTTNVAKLYDIAYTDATISKVDSDGNPDTNAVLRDTNNGGRNRDSFITDPFLVGIRRVVTKFKYYHDAGAVKGGDAKDVLRVMHAKATGTISSTTPTVTIGAASATLNYRHNTDSTSQTKTITGLQPKKWYDVTFETIFDPVAFRATSTLTIDDQSVTTFISMEDRPSYAANGYDEPAVVSFSTEYNHGGRFFLDDLSITKYSVPSDNFTAAVNEFKFNGVVSGKTSNLQDNIYESWPAGLMKTYKRGNDEYQVEWSSSDESVISTDGTVTRRSYPQTVALTAKIIDSADVYATRTFYVKVAPLDGASDAQIVSEYAENVIKESAYSSEVTATSNKITKNIKPLPSTDAAAGIDILWSASPTGYIDVLTGEVTRPNFSASDVEVTLTAIVSKNGEQATKSIKYTVVKNPDPNTVLSDALDNLTVTTEPLNKVTKNLNLATEYNGATITWDTSAHSQISETGIVTRGEDEVTADIVASITFDGVTKTKTFTITVLPTAQKMLEKDIELIDKTGWDALVSDFQVPLVGEKYGSILTWSSDSDYVQVGEGGKITVKRPPNSHPSDLEVVLIVNAKMGRDEVNVPITITVLRQKDDQSTVNELAATINFDIIRGTNPSQDQVTKNLPLPTGFDSDKAATVEWSSSNEAVVKTNGEVIRPLPGADDETVTLTAVVKKNYATSTPVDISFKVRALTDSSELLQEAKEALVFSQLSTEKIDNVTKNLYLPATGKYGATITWTSNSKNIVVSGTEGIVSQPEWGEPNSNILLTATISYDGQTAQKSFNITIPESDTYVESAVMLNENFNSWTNDKKFGSLTSTGKWFEPLASSGTRADIANNIGGASNPAIVVYKASDAAEGYLSYISDSYIESTEAGIGMKFFVNNDFAGCATVDVHATGSDMSIAKAYINGSDSTIDIVTANNTLTPITLKLEKGVFTKNAWNDLRVDVNTKINMFSVYLNGECITANGFVTNKETGEAFVSVNGIPYSNKNANSKGISGIRWFIDDGSIYIDDLYASTYTVHTEDQKNVADIWEAEFLSTVNINYIDKSFTLPEMMLEKVDGITIRANSSDGSTLNNSGIINMNYLNPVYEPTAFTLTVKFDNGTTVYKRYYTLMLYPPAVVDTSLTDEQAVEKDFQTVVDFLAAEYYFGNLKGDINLSAANVVNGSTITATSSDTSVITNDGKVTLGDTMKTVTFTVTVKKGAASKSQTYSITVGIKTPAGGGSGGGAVGGGGGAKPPVSGENTKPQTGIEVGTPEDDNKENEGQGTASNFTDVAKDHWAYDQINYMVENKIMNGVGDGKIEPERTINREEFVKMLVVTLGLDLKEAAADFTDVDKNEWYAPYVATIKEKGLINGFEDGTFGIGQNISRQDLAVLIYRSTRLAAEDVKDAFADDAEIADYAKDAVYTLRDLGIINGKGDGKFDPSASATRAETATMLYKAIKAGLFEL